MTDLNLTYRAYAAANTARGVQSLPRALWVELHEATALSTREAKLTDAEFASLVRNDRGDIIDLPDAFLFLTAAQVEKLGGDDYTRYDDLQEEVRCLMLDAIAEFF